MLGRIVRGIVNYPLPENVKVFIGVSMGIGLSVYLTLGGKQKKPGEHLFSSEKPEFIRGEVDRNLDEEKAKASAGTQGER